MEAILEHEGAAETGPLDDARGEDLQGLAHSYDMEPRPGHCGFSVRQPHHGRKAA